MSFMPFLGLQTFKVQLFSGNSLWSNILNHFQTKVTPMNLHESPFLICFSIVLMKMNEMIKCLNSVNLWNWEGLKRKNLEVMCNFWHYSTNAGSPESQYIPGEPVYVYSTMSITLFWWSRRFIYFFFFILLQFYYW